MLRSRRPRSRGATATATNPGGRRGRRRGGEPRQDRGGTSRRGRRATQETPHAVDLRRQRGLSGPSVPILRELRFPADGRENGRVPHGDQPGPGGVRAGEPAAVRRGVPEQHGRQSVHGPRAAPESAGVRMRRRRFDGGSRDVRRVHAMAGRRGGLAGVRRDARRPRGQPPRQQRTRVLQVRRSEPPAQPGLRRRELRFSRRILSRPRSVLARTACACCSASTPSGPT